MEIFICSRHIAPGVSPKMDGHASAAIIRITTWSPWVPLAHRDEFNNELRIMFGDFTDDAWHRWKEKNPSLTFPIMQDDGEFLPVPIPGPITDEQAQEIIDFVNANKDVSMFIVHCDAGYSRSPAVGLFIAEHLGHWDQAEKIRKMTDAGVFSPNPTVLQRLRKVSGQEAKRQQELEETFSKVNTEE